MKSIVSTLINILSALLLVLGAYFLTVSDQNKKKKAQAQLSPKALVLQKHLLQYGSPERIEIRNLTERLKVEVEEIKKIKIPLKNDSQFYVTVDLFTDENDLTAPLVAQIQFFNRANENKVKEDVINLD